MRTPRCEKLVRRPARGPLQWGMTKRGVTDVLHDLTLLLNARNPLILLETDELGRADELVRTAAQALKLPFYSWTRTKGLREGAQLAASKETLLPDAALAEVERLMRPGVYLFQDLGADLGDPLVAGRLRDAATPFLARGGALVLAGGELNVPAALRPLSARLPLPSAAEHRELVAEVYREVSSRAYTEVHLTETELHKLARGLEGLTRLEAEKLLTKAMLSDGRLDTADLGGVAAAKKAALGADGLLGYLSAGTGLAEVAGLGGLKSWLATRRRAVTEPEQAAAFELTFPKGLLLVGVQGCGKSLCAKAVAHDWGLPLLKLEPGTLYDQYVGETERNFRRAVRLAETMAPTVLWIDELEKVFAAGSGDGDGGLSGRLLGGFLSWLQERREGVFVVATANDVAALPPELVRKGRFDEIFFVDLPDAAARRETLALHLSRRERNPAAFDLDALAAATDGFSGAELEALVVAALYAAFAAATDLSTALLLREAESTRPLSRLMPERVAALRAWAHGRTRSAA